MNHVGRIYSKRLDREEKELGKRYNNCLLEYKDNCNEMTVIIDGKIIKAVLPLHYPFKPPNLFIENNRYIKMLQSNFTDFRSKDDKCLCCKSLTCSHNWCPSKKVMDVIEEYLENKRFFILLIKKRFVRSVCLKHHIPLELEDMINYFL